MAKRDLQGRVQGVNERGVNIDGTWYNFSNFFKGDRTPPQGSTVVSVIDNFKGRDYLAELVVIGTALPNAVTAPTAGAFAPSAGTAFRSDDTNKRIARQVALKAAVEFAAYRHPDAEASDVTSYSKIFEAYLNESYSDASTEDAA